MPTGPAVVSSAGTQFGPALVVGTGPYAGCSLYLLTSDTPANPKTYGCTGTVCAVEIWPALLTTGRPVAGRGVNPTLLGTVARTIGGQAVHQVTYAGYPLYRFSLDQAAGDTTGEQFFDPGTTPQGLWYLVSPGRGTPEAAPTTFADRTVPLVHPGATTPYGTADGLTVDLDQGLGGLHFPVYTSSADMHQKSVCDSTAQCALRWPAVLTMRSPSATGAIGGMLGTVGRPPGMHQVTFDGHPLYVFILDAYFPPGAGPPVLPHTIAAHGTGIHPTFTGLDVGTFHLVPAP
jgi:predicted lipoprotein with Yx(FWY)xxD motif